jgi:hypothetical protein
MQISIDEFYGSIETYDMLGHAPSQFVVNSHKNIENAVEHYIQELHRIVQRN